MVIPFHLINIMLCEINVIHSWKKSDTLIKQKNIFPLDYTIKYLNIQHQVDQCSHFSGPLLKPQAVELWMAQLLLGSEAKIPRASPSGWMQYKPESLPEVMNIFSQTFFLSQHIFCHQCNQSFWLHFLKRKEMDVSSINIKLIIETVKRLKALKPLKTRDSTFRNIPLCVHSETSFKGMFKRIKCNSEMQKCKICRAPLKPQLKKTNLTLKNENILHVHCISDDFLAILTDD